MMLLSSVVWTGSWNNDMDTARFFAKKRNQMLMVFVESQHCKWCSKMKNTTFSSSRIIPKYQTMTRLKVNGGNKHILKKLPPIKGVPAVFFMDPSDNQILETVSGYRDAESFLRSINSAQKKFEKKHLKARER